MLSRDGLGQLPAAHLTELVAEQPLSIARTIEEVREKISKVKDHRNKASAAASTGDGDGPSAQISPRPVS